MESAGSALRLNPVRVQEKLDAAPRLCRPLALGQQHVENRPR